jgi:branched-chain amino acid transport system permease protein
MNQLIWNGLALGSFYGLVGIGLAITRGLWGILNFAQGEFMILGAYLVFILAITGVSVPIAILLGVIGAGLILAIVSRVTFHYTHQNLVNGFILSTGIGLIIQNTLEITVGSAAREISITGLGSIDIFGVSIPLLRLIFLGITISLVFATSWFLGNTKTGRYIRAAALNANAAKLVGINVDKIEIVSYIISGVLAGVAGVGLLLQFVVTPYYGARYVLKGVAAMLLGGAYRGLGNIGSTFIIGIMLGIVESIGGSYTSMRWQDTFTYIFLYVGLVFATRIRKR